MPAQLFDIYFSGKILNNQDQAEVRERIRRLFNAEEGMLERLFSGVPVKIKGGVDEEEASRYRVAFRDAGALVDIKLAEATASIKPPAPTTAESDTREAERDDGTLTLLPPNTGSLIDCAPKIEPREIPDISYMALAPEGTIIDESREAPPAKIDTSSLTVSPAQSGTLEDCRPAVKPYPIPDISNLRIEQPEEENPG